MRFMTQLINSLLILATIYDYSFASLLIKCKKKYILKLINEKLKYSLNLKQQTKVMM